MSKLVLENLKEKVGADILETHSDFGDDTAIVSREKWKAICRHARVDPALDFDMLVDLCGVDYPERGATGERIEVVLHLYSLGKRHRVRLKTRIGDDDMDG